MWHAILTTKKVTASSRLRLLRTIAPIVEFMSSEILWKKWAKIPDERAEKAIAEVSRLVEEKVQRRGPGADENS